MQLIILAGGPGRRLARDNESLPKPLSPIGGKPVLWHIMKMFSSQGVNDFIICLGYKAKAINESMKSCTEIVSGKWSVSFLDTGIDSTKLSRIKTAARNLDSGTNLISYADNLCALDLRSLLKTHRENDKMITITGVRPRSPYGHIFREDGRVKFKEKPYMMNSLINAGFMVFEREFIRYIKDKDGELETDVLSSLADEDLLNVYEHSGSWNGINNLKEYENVCEIYESGNAYWETWKT